MRSNFITYREYQVLLNYPFDDDFESQANAMHFAVVAAGLVPVCAKDLTTPDRPRLDMLVEVISNCKYSAHDFSRCTGEGPNNFARFNMPIEMGMSLFNALQNQRQTHRCAFFVVKPHDYKAFASDLGGLDPLDYDSDAALVSRMYEWLRDVGAGFDKKRPTAKVLDRYKVFLSKSATLRGSGKGGRATHREAQELMFQLCSDCKWWDWRANDAGKLAFPQVPLAWVAADYRRPKQRGR
jgi:hypothetical protein